MPRERTYPRAVPNHEEPMSTKSTVKDTAINAAVWTLSAAVVLGIGTWIWKSAKRRVIKEPPEANQIPQQQQPTMASMANSYLAGNPWPMMHPQMQTPMVQMPMQMYPAMPMPSQPNYQDMIPAALQMQPNLQGPQGHVRRRRVNSSEPPPWFQQWASQQNARMDNFERKLEESYEDDYEEGEE